MDKLKFVVFGILLFIITILLIAGSFVLGLQWWLGPVSMVFVVSFAFGCYFLYVFMRESIKKYRQINPEKPSYERSLSKKWKKAISTLKDSDLSQYGDPVYVLPWYLVIGSSGSGKTSAIENCGLQTKMGTFKPPKGITKNCHWYFFEKAVIIDSAGRYVIPEQSEDKDEWLKLIDYLFKYRRREPLNGVVVTVSAEKLLKLSPQQLADEAENIRKSLSDIWNRLGITIPVYVFVTKSDQIQGMRQFTRMLPSDKISQTMGYLSDADQNLRPGEFVKTVFESLNKKLIQLRMLITFNRGVEYVDHEALFFPEELEKTKDSLICFMESLFSESVYQMSSVLRGLYFTSALQDGTSYSHLLDNLGYVHHGTKLPKDEDGFFLSDLFSKTLPADRSMFSLTGKILIKKRLTRYFLTGIWAIGIGAILFSMSEVYSKHCNILAEISPNQEGIFYQAGTENEVLQKIEQLRKLIRDIEAKNPDSLFTNFGFMKTSKNLNELKEEYCDKYFSKILYELDTKIQEEIKTFSKESDLKKVGQTIIHLARRINLLNQRIDKACDDEVPMLNRLDGSFVTDILTTIDSSTMVNFDQQYQDYLRWCLTVKLERSDKITLEKLFDELLARPSVSLECLVNLCEYESQINLIGLSNYWKGDKDKHCDIVVGKSYTKDGYRYIRQMIGEIRSALPEWSHVGPKLEEKEQTFFDYYFPDAFRNWFSFISEFQKGRDTLLDQNAEEVFVRKIHTLEDPYFLLMNDVQKHLGDFAENFDDSLQWFSLIGEFLDFKDEFEKEQKLNKSGVHRVIAKSKLGKKLKKVAPKRRKSEAIIAMKNFTESIESIKNLVLSESFALVSETFDGSGSSEISKANKALEKIRVEICKGTSSSSDQLITGLLRGSLDYLWDIAITNTVRDLQRDWRKDVVEKRLGLSGDDLTTSFFKSGGFVNEFLNKKAGIFLERDIFTGTFRAKEIEGQKIPFSEAFLEYLEKGHININIENVSYDLIIDGRATELGTHETKLGADLRVAKLYVELHSSGIKDQTIKNYQNETRDDWTWVPSKTSRVTVRIGITDLNNPENELHVSKVYRGKLSLAEFVSKFKSGHLTLEPDDFPLKKKELEKFGVDYIILNLDFSGDYEEMTKLIETKPGEPPKTLFSLGGQSA